METNANISPVDVLTFLKFFRGNDRFYGVTEVNKETDQNGKIKSNSYLVHAPPTQANILSHLLGHIGMGLSPLRDDDTVFFGAIDIDNEEVPLSDIVKAIFDFNLPLLSCRSKSGKLHLYIFFNEPVNAQDCIEILQWYRTAFGLSQKTEIFPKQTHVNYNSYPSWINLPCFGDSRPALYPGPITLKETLLRMEDICFSYKDHKNFIESLYFWDAPPCIISSILLRNLQSGERNTWFFAFGVYLSFKELDLEEYLNKVNDSMFYPLPDTEIQNTITGLQKKTYFYPCKQLHYCNRTECRTQKYGFNYKLSSGLSYGTLTQYLTDPPYYEWEINGQTLVFYSETELLSQNRFRELCLRQLHLVPRPVPNAQWTETVNKACENLCTKVMDVPEETLSSGSLFTGCLESYFVFTRLTDKKSDVKYDRIFIENDLIYFSAKKLYKYITEVVGFRQFSPSEVHRRLINDFEAVAPRPGSILWTIPYSLFEKGLQENSVYKDENEESEISEVTENDVSF